MTKTMVAFILCLALACDADSATRTPLSREVAEYENMSLKTETLQENLTKYVAGKKAQIGVAVVSDGEVVAEVNGSRAFPMLSVYKFPQALAVADYCTQCGLTLNDSIAVAAGEIREDTWSPMRERYGVRDLTLPVSELLEYSLKKSDNNACDILFSLIGGTQTADSFVKETGYRDTEIHFTEDDMHRDTNLCYDNRTTPLDMAMMFDSFHRLQKKSDNPFHKAIWNMLTESVTGKDRLASALKDTGAAIAHKTGTGDTDSRGRVIGVNDAGYVVLPDGRGYAVAVFITDSEYGLIHNERMIAEIAGIVFRHLGSPVK